AYNGGPGILVGTTVAFPNAAVIGHAGNAILSNRIFANGGLGIDLTGDPNGHADGVTANNTGDGDLLGGHNLQNYPVILGASYASGQMTVRGSLNSTPSISPLLVLANTYLIQFFASTTADPTGPGEGEQFLGSTTVRVNTSGDASFNVTFAAP